MTPPYFFTMAITVGLGVDDEAIGQGGGGGGGGQAPHGGAAGEADAHHLANRGPRCGFAADILDLELFASARCSMPSDGRRNAGWA